MGLKTKSSASSGSFLPVPVGMHLARCYRIIDLGTQKTEWEGKTKHIPKVMLQFEVHGEDEAGQPILTAAGKPMTISKNYSNMLSERASLRADLCSWRGRDFTKAEAAGFELSNVLGVWAMITAATSIGKNGGEYTNIVSINPVPSIIKQAGLPEGHNPTQIFWIEEPDMEMFESFSDSLQEKIKLSPEWEATHKTQPNNAASGTVNPKAPFNDFPDDIPF